MGVHPPQPQSSSGMIDKKNVFFKADQSQNERDPKGDAE
jgi:hypothetical protein